jgi:hypothetical protein
MTGLVDVPSMAALGLGPIMLVAARIHVALAPSETEARNVTMLALWVFVVWGRWST